jgi:hypothetical protein
MKIIIYDEFFILKSNIYIYFQKNFVQKIKK